MNEKLVEKQENNEEDFRQLKRVFAEKEKYEKNRHGRTATLIKMRADETIKVLNVKDKHDEARCKRREKLIALK